MVWRKLIVQEVCDELGEVVEIEDLRAKTPKYYKTREKINNLQQVE